MLKKIVVALGGNAILQPGQHGTYENQYANVKKTSHFLAGLVAEGHTLVITHGNGPQVGNLLRQNEEAAEVTPPLPLDVLNGESQGFIGYMLLQALQNEFTKRELPTSVVNLVTRVEVSPNDPDFLDPTKPVGLFYTKEEAQALTKERGWVMKEDANRGWRRVVPSPLPLRILEAPIANRLAEMGYVVIASGGGGIPVTKDIQGLYQGIEAVIDKDRSGCILASEVEADIFMILTDVENAYLHYGTPEQKALTRLTPDEAEGYLLSGQFSAGSMKPKVESALRFAKNSGGVSIICSLAKVTEALQGKSGTWIEA